MAGPTQEQVDALEAALIQAAVTGKAVAFADRSWTSHDLPELRALLAEMKRLVNPASAPNYRLAAHSKGV